MSRRIARGRAGVWAGVVGALALAGCGKEPTPVAQVPAPVISPPTEPAQPVIPAPPTTPTPPTTTGTQPTGGGTGGFIPFTPLPGIPTGTQPTGGSTFVPPTSPTFTPPDTLGGGKPTDPVTPQPPKPTDPQPPKPTDPQPPTGTQPDPTKPPELKFPKEIAGRDLKSWLKELEYAGGGPVQKDAQVRETAVKIIPSFGPDARKPAVKPLIEAIRVDPDPGVQVAAITVVSSMGFDMRADVQPVMQNLNMRLKAPTTNSVVKMYCVRSLASFGPDAVAYIGAFRDSCLDPSWETRREVAIALSLVGATPMDKFGKPEKKDGHVIGPNRVAIDTLLDFQLRDSSVTVRMEAVKSLLALGPPVPKNPADFVELTKDIQKSVGDVVLFESGSSKAPKVNKYGGSPDRGTYVWALLLQVMYDDRKISDNLKELARLVGEPDGPRADEVRLFALQALGVGGGLLKTLKETPGAENKATAEKVVKAVTDALKYEHEPLLQYTALQTLVMFGKTAADSGIPELQKVAAKPVKPVPADAPKGTQPDDSMQKLAKQAIEVLQGTRKAEDFGKDDPKPGEKKDPEKKDDAKAVPPKEPEKK